MTTEPQTDTGQGDLIHDVQVLIAVISVAQDQAGLQPTQQQGGAGRRCIAVSPPGLLQHPAAWQLLELNAAALTTTLAFSFQKGCGRRIGHG